MTLALATVLLPCLAACLLAVLPAGFVSAWLDLCVSGAASLLACILLGQDDAVLGDFRLDSLVSLFMTLIALSSVAARWTSLRRLSRSRSRRAAGQLTLGSMLLACLSADPLLSWLGLAAATAAALYPALPWAWDRVSLAGAGLALALFGIIAAHADPALGILAPAGLILGYAVLGGVVPGLLVLLLALMLRLHDLPGATASGPMLIALGLTASLACGLGLLIRPDHPRRLALLRLGQGGAAVAAFGLGGPEATVAGLVQVILLALSGVAADVGGRPGPERVAVAAGLGGLPPLGVFPGLTLIVIATAHRAAWLLLPLGAGLATIGWATVIRLPSPRWIGPVTAAPVWIPLALVLLIGWCLPEGAAEWLRTAAALTR